MDWPDLEMCGDLLYPTGDNGLSSEHTCEASLFWINCDNAASAAGSDVDGK